MSSGITLSSATRQNLLSLQGTADLLATTQNRLATNKKVNSALDNPTNFFTASGLSDRSKSLSNLLDGISNGIQTIQAANTGLTKLQGLTDQLKSVAQQALASSNAFSAKATNTSVALPGATASNLLSQGATQAVADQTIPAGRLPTSTPVVATGTGTSFGNGVATQASVALVPPTLAATASVTFKDSTGATLGSAVTFAAGDKIDDVVRKINAQTSTTTISATKDAAGTGYILSSGTTGTNFTVTGSDATATTGFTSTASTLTANGAGAATTKITIAGTDINIATGSDEGTVIGLINAQTSKTGVTASDVGGAIKLTGASDGSAFTVSKDTGATVNNLSGINIAPSGGTFVANSNTLLVAGLGFKDGDNIVVNGQSVGITAFDNLASFAQKVSVATSGTVSASFDATAKKFSFTAADANTGVSLSNGNSLTSLVSKLGYSAAANVFGAGQGLTTAGAVPTFTKSVLDGKAITVQVGTGTAVALTFGSNPGQISSLTQLNAALAPANAQASIDSLTGKITITTMNDNGADDLTITSSAGFTGGTTKAALGGDGANTRNGLVTNYNNLLGQINQLASDAGFNGLNLLAGDTLKLAFNEKNTSSLNIQGTAISAANLGLNVIGNSDFQENASINKLMATISSATSQLKTQASSLGSNLAVVQNRQDFTKQIINVLDTGAANLTNADLNEEAANSQALSTRNSLGISALSLANQAQQSVLQLLR